MNQKVTTIYLFPGQGSQTKGMGRDLFEKYSHLIRQADEIVGYSVAELCLEDPQGTLGQTQYTQVALYVVNSLYYLEAVRQSGILPNFLIGHSVGELNALFAADVFDFRTGVELVAKRGALMAEVSGGGMAAIIGLSTKAIMKTLKKHGFARLSIANLNSPKQTVIAGPREDIERVNPIFIKSGAEQVIPLKVSAAFHSPYMQEASEKFKEFLQQYRLSGLKIPVISNYTAQPHRDEDLKENLSLQISHPVRWTESINYLLKYPNPVFIEVGARKVLTKLVDQIREVR